MNRENILKVRDAIAAAHEDMFDMSVWERHDCGSPQCIGGWAEHIQAREFPNRAPDANKFLGLTDDQSHDLFLPHGWQLADLFTKEKALETLDHLAATGEVVWNVELPRGWEKFDA